MSHLAVIPTRKLFADVGDAYARVLHCTNFDHTDLIVLCLDNWALLSEVYEVNDFTAFSPWLEEVTFRHWRRKKISFQEHQLTTYAMYIVLKSCYEEIQTWIEMARLQAAIKTIQRVRLRQCLSARALLVELMDEL